MNTYWMLKIINSAIATPAWVWIVLAVVVAGLIGFMVWVIKETWIG